MKENDFNKDSALTWDGDFVIVNPFNTYEENVEALLKADIPKSRLALEQKLLNSYKENGVFKTSNSKADKITVKMVKPTEDYKLILLFSNNQTRIFDARRLLKLELYFPLQHLQFFMRAHIVYGKVVWDDRIEISTEKLLFESHISKIGYTDLVKNVASGESLC